LGVARDASAADIRSAYRQLVLVSTRILFHPANAENAMPKVARF
jgi:DnaJ-class molecular chaperone